MNRSQLARRPRLAFAAWLVTLLQLVGILHFALIPHAFSAALGGMVHVHTSSSASSAHSSERVHAPGTAALVSETASCSADLCPTSDVPPSSSLHTASTVTGFVSYGSVRLLSEREVASVDAERVFPSAPKTSPPV
jgi:hypothetical protein